MVANTRTISLDRSLGYAYAELGSSYGYHQYNVRLVRSSVMVQQKPQQIEYPYFEKTTHNFGNVPILGGVVRTRFCLLNPSKREVSITNVTKTNTGITVEWDKDVIQPGGKAFVYVTFNPSGRQGTTLNCSLNVQLSNDKTHVLTVKGKVQ